MAYTKTVSAADLALVLGIGERRVNQLVAKKILTRENGLFDLAENVQAFVAFRERAVAAGTGQVPLRRCAPSFIARERQVPGWTGWNASGASFGWTRSDRAGSRLRE